MPSYSFQNLKVMSVCLIFQCDCKLWNYYYLEDNNVYYRVLFYFQISDKASNNRTHGKTSFQTSWLQDDRFKKCLKNGKDPHDTISLFFNNCQISIGNMGISALISHAQGKKA